MRSARLLKLPDGHADIRIGGCCSLAFQRGCLACASESYLTHRIRRCRSVPYHPNQDAVLYRVVSPGDIPI